ncbi:MAG: hypothetical protein ABUJ98_13820 [Hyphomicrobium sp.]
MVDKPNYKEVVADSLAERDFKGFCLTRCGYCPLNLKDEGAAGEDCLFVGPNEDDRITIVAVCRHVLAPGVIKDWTDLAEIRARIAEMLDDELREKFLGKAEKKYQKYQTYHSDGGCYTYRAQLTDDNTPEFHWLISLGEASDEIIAAFRDEDTRDRVLAFLNADASEPKTCRECGWFAIRDDATPGTYGRCKSGASCKSEQNLPPTTPACNRFENPKYR